MPASKIQDEREADRWFEEGKTYQWMVDEYLRKYNIKTSVSMWATRASRRGFDRRIVRDPALIPWELKEEHRWLYPVMMLRVEARKRAGVTVRDEDESRLKSWLKELNANNLVVHYDPETEEGFHYIPRQPGDEDLIHEPKK
ncbi:hypothetical protein AB0G73_10565 [Streptomyces sp. NPDC020719]|uniref:hypothetical protein n=1 Tax=Streptomyces sp. NPDC020719 TaxID=3154896 RepID=UPI0034058EB7